jgi:hypothetical protein
MNIYKKRYYTVKTWGHGLFVHEMSAAKFGSL